MANFAGGLRQQNTFYHRMTTDELYGYEKRLPNYPTSLLHDVGTEEDGDKIKRIANLKLTYLDGVFGRSTRLMA